MNGFTHWRKTRLSMPEENCVEVGRSTHSIGVRDTKAHGKGPVLEFTPAQWTAFTRSFRA